jgi:hypothetical protein
MINEDLPPGLQEGGSWLGVIRDEIKKAEALKTCQCCKYFERNKPLKNRPDFYCQFPDYDDKGTCGHIRDKFVDCYEPDFSPHKDFGCNEWERKS